jgi:hypothetical protein
MTLPIPTVDQVIEYMGKKKPNWPKAFIEWYSNKFWNSYEKSGWKLSAGRGGLVKNWQACFNSNWQTLKYKEDLDMLALLTPKPKEIDSDTIEFLNEVLGEYRQNPDHMEEIRLASCYDWMKEYKLIKLKPEQRELAINASKVDLLKGKALAVKFVFDHLVTNLLTFNYFFNELA